MSNPPLVEPVTIQPDETKYISTLGLALGELKQGNKEWFDKLPDNTGIKKDTDETR